MAAACDALEYDEIQLRYLKAALEVDSRTPTSTALAAAPWASKAKFDDAIVCWHRVQQAKPEDEEARRAIGDLTVEKTIKHAGYEDAETSTEVMADKQARPSGMGTGPAKLTPEQQLEKPITKDPGRHFHVPATGRMHIRRRAFRAAEKSWSRPCRSPAARSTSASAGRRAVAP